MALFTKKSAIVPVQPDTLFSPAIEPTEDTNMSKPSSYFSIQEHTFMVPGRKENKGKTLENRDYALFFGNEVMAIPFQPISTVPERMKYIRLVNIKELVGLLEKGYPEETTKILLKEIGYKEIVQTLVDNKILVLDFLSFLKEELAKIPAKTRGRQPGVGSSTGEKTDHTIQPIVVALASLKAGLDPEELLNLMRGTLEDETKVSKILAILAEKEKTLGRDAQGFIRLRSVRGSAKIKAKK